MLQQRTAVPRSEADVKPLRRLAIEAAFIEELPSCHGVRTAQVLDKEIRRQPERLRQPAAGTRLQAWAGLVGVAQLNAYPVGQPLNRLDKAQIVDLAHEVDDVTALGASAEAIPIAAGRGDLETWGFLVVEGAQTLHRAARAAECDVGADHFLDPCTIAYSGDVFLVDPAAHGRESMFHP